MSRRTSRRRQQAMNARRRSVDPERRRAWREMKAALQSGRIMFLSDDALRRNLAPLRVIRADPDTFPWYSDFGAGPVFRRMDGSAIGPMKVRESALADGSGMVQWEIVEVRPV